MFSLVAHMDIFPLLIGFASLNTDSRFDDSTAQTADFTTTVFSA